MNIQIASASEEQSAVAEEINRNVISIRDVADQTSETTGQLKETGDELKQLSDRLTQMLNRYQA